MYSQTNQRLAIISQHILPSTNTSIFTTNPTSATVAQEVRSRVTDSQNNKKVISLEELKNQVGKEIGVSNWLTITQERVNEFADCTADWQWIHVDPERAAKESPFKGAVAHGFLTLSLGPFFQAEVLPKVEGVKMAVNYGLNKVRFVHPVHVGRKLRARVTLKELKEIPGGLQATYVTTFEVEGTKKPACISEGLANYYL